MISPSPQCPSAGETSPSAPGPSRKPEVAIYRNNLFRVSETFITLQAQSLRRFQPFYLGRFRFGEPPPSTDAYSLADRSKRHGLTRALWHLLTRDPRFFRPLLGDRRPDLIHAHFGIDGVYALPFAQQLGVPLITTFHGFDATLSTAALLSSPAWAHYPFRRRQLARSGDLFLCASNFLRERVLAMGFPADRTLVHYIGMDCRGIRPRDNAEERPVILHVARLVEFKGTKYLLRAFARLTGAAATFSLVIIGEGPLRARLEDLSRRLGIADRVRFLGAQPHAQVLGWMRQAAVLVLPSILTSTGRTEGLGMVLLEAAATGVAIIGSRRGGIPEAVVDGETGWLVADRDDQDLARRLGELLSDQDARRRMGRAGRANVERNFDLDRQTLILEQHYQAVLDHPRSRIPAAQRRL